MVWNAVQDGQFTFGLSLRCQPRAMSVSQFSPIWQWNGILFIRLFNKILHRPVIKRYKRPRGVFCV